MTRTVTSAVSRPVLKGRQPVAALWLPSAWFKDDARQHIILQVWRPGATVTRFVQGDVLRFAATEHLDCTRTGAWPLRWQGQTLTSAPLHARELAALPAADVWIVVGAEVLSLHWSGGVVLDPAEWIDTDQAALHETARWSWPERVATPVIEDARTVREVLGDKVPPASADQLAFLEKLRQSATGRRASATGPGAASRPAATGGGSTASSLWIPLLVLGIGLFGAMLNSGPSSEDGSDGGTGFLWSIALALVVNAAIALLLWKLLRAAWRAPPRFDVPIEPPRPYAGNAGTSGIRSEAGSERAGHSDGPARGPVLPARRSRLSPQRWREWITRLAVATRLSRAIGRQQAKYLQRMLDMFESGDLEQALRHAIALTGPDAETLGQALGTPSARKHLGMGRDGTGASATMHLGTDFEEHLRRLYRKTFEQLDRQQRVDEAVFVLAELLGARQEALDYLEKHKRFAQAAELALAWDMPSEVIVRLHCLAGDWRHAVAVAHRDASFASTILQLEKKWPDAAHDLREHWGRLLAKQGEWLSAVDAVWPVARLRDEAAGWIAKAEGAGGLLGARALVRRAALLPDTLTRCEEQLVALRDEPELHAERAALAGALLLTKDRNDGISRLAAMVAPAVLLDVSQHKRGLDKKSFQTLLDMGGDRFLQSDLPSSGWPAVAASPLRDRPAPLECDAPEAGVHDVFDAASLEDGSLLVALGEAGVVLIDVRGRLRHRFATPARRLVVATGSHQVLAITPRESAWRVARLDLVTRDVHALGMLTASHLAQSFDGLAWTVARGSRVQVLDTSNGVEDVLWQVADLPGEVVALAADDVREQLLVQAPPDERGISTHAELWGYTLPRRQLTRRDTVSPCVPGQLRLLDASAGVVDFSVASEEGAPLVLRWGVHQFELGHPIDGPLNIWLGPQWLLLSTAWQRQQVLHCLQVGTAKVGARIRWPHDATVQARWCGSTCVVFDDHGRVMSLDTATCEQRSVSV